MWTLSLAGLLLSFLAPLTLAVSLNPLAPIKWIFLPGHDGALPPLSGTPSIAIFCWSYSPKTKEPQLPRFHLQMETSRDKWTDIHLDFHAPPRLIRCEWSVVQKLCVSTYPYKKFERKSWLGNWKCSDVRFVVPSEIPSGRYKMRLMMENGWFGMMERVYSRIRSVQVFDNEQDRARWFEEYISEIAEVNGGDGAQDGGAGELITEIRKESKNQKMFPR